MKRLIPAILLLTSGAACTKIETVTEPGPIDGTFALTLLFCNGSFQAITKTLVISNETGQLTNIDGSCSEVMPLALQYTSDRTVDIDVQDGNCFGTGGDCGNATCGRDTDPAQSWDFTLAADGTLNLSRTEDAATGGYCALNQNVVLTGTKQ